MIEYRIIFTHKGSLGIQYPSKGSLDRPLTVSTRNGLIGLKRFAMAVLATNSTGEDEVILAVFFFCLRGVEKDIPLAIGLAVRASNTPAKGPLIVPLQDLPVME